MNFGKYLPDNLCRWLDCNAKNTSDITIIADNTGGDCPNKDLRAFVGTVPSGRFLAREIGNLFFEEKTDLKVLKDVSPPLRSHVDKVLSTV